MSQWQEQIITNQQAIQQIIDSAKNINELDDIVSSLNNSDLIAVYKNAGTPKATLEELKAFVLKEIRPFVFVEGCLVEKVNTTDYTTIEVGDYVYFKRVNDNGDIVTLIGHTYKNTLANGDKNDKANYEQEQIITT